MTILIIDDDREICSTTGVLLEDEYEVLMAFSGAEGLYTLSKEVASLVILDYKLPDMDGIAVLKNIKENYKIPVIMITGIGDKETVLKSWRHNADYYIDKPFKIEELKEKITELLKPLSEPVPFKALNINPLGLSPYVRVALEYIRSNLSTLNSVNLTLKEISAIANVSPKYLSDIFKKECGQGVYQIMTNLKIERAKELLDKGRDIKEIAFELGFKHPNNFCKFFKKLTGKTPSELRNT
ncbi:MAG: response regulator [Nitrospirota bacterium]